MEFEPEKFLQNPSLEIFEKLKKQELLSLGEHLKLAVRQLKTKQAVKNVVIRALVDQGIFSPEALEIMADYEGDTVKMRCLELDHEYRMRQLEIVL